MKNSKNHVFAETHARELHHSGRLPGRRHALALGAGIVALAINPAMKAQAADSKTFGNFEYEHYELQQLEKFLANEEKLKIELVADQIATVATCAVGSSETCTGGDYFDALQAASSGWSLSDRAFWVASGASQMPILDALERAGSSLNQHAEKFGSSSQYSYHIRVAKRACQDVWDAYNIPWKIVSIKPDILHDADGMQYLYMTGFGMDSGRAQSLSQRVSEYFSRDKFNGPNQAYFTANAFAFPAYGVMTSSGLLKENITLIGDGILETFDLLGYAENDKLRMVPGVLVAHEFYHHLQTSYALSSAENSAVAHRTLSENAADAGSSYAVTHIRGMSLNSNRVEDVVRVFSSMGQCSTGAAATHGTPTQRQQSAVWGHSLQASQRPLSTRIPVQQFDSNFVKYWESI